MATTTAVEGMHFLTQSPVRVTILELLYEEGALSKHELRDRIDASRVTIRRNLDALEERHLITTAERTCELTPLGEVVREDILPAIETAAVVDRLRPFVRWFPEERLEFDVRALAGATIVVADSTDPYAPVNRHIDAMTDADRVRALLPAVGLPAMTTGRDRVVESECRHELVIGENLVPTIRNRPEYRTLLDDMLESENCEVLVSEHEIPFYLGLFEDYIQIGVEDDDGVPKALVETDASEVREWAEQIYEDYSSISNPIEI